MVDIVINSGDYVTLSLELQRMGLNLKSEQETKIIRGPLVDGGFYLLNIVGKVFLPSEDTMSDIDGNIVPILKAIPGYWARLRINGDENNFPSFSDKIIQYHWNDALEGWTSDGITAAPSWVADIGVIG